jgi:hypothetical protein
MMNPKLANLSIYEAYMNVDILSVKHSTYFQVYEELLIKFKNKPITFVEVGVSNGGSLFMWRKFLGTQARIIGIDLNPIAKKFEEDGFEIFIGSQSDELFWINFFKEVGQIDVLLDDGGHSNEQQIITLNSCIRNIKDDGLLIVEDTHTSYMPAFGNPSKFSFINYTKYLIDLINSRFSSAGILKNELANYIYSITSYESIVCFHINRKKCFSSSPTSNNGVSSDAENYLQHDEILKDFNRIQTLKFLLSKYMSAIYVIPGLSSIKISITNFINYVYFKRKLGRFFKNN